MYSAKTGFRDLPAKSKFLAVSEADSALHGSGLAQARYDPRLRDINAATPVIV